MTIRTRSVFYYVDEITENNLYLNFIEPNEDNVELTAQLDVGSYTMTDLMTEVQSKLNQTGDVEYTVSFDRDTRLVTISGSDDFDLLVTTGSNAGLSAFQTIGFNTDKTGSNSYESDVPMGTEYLPQFFLQNYVDKLDNVEGVQSSINESASGLVEVVTFGQVSFYEFNIRWVSDLVPKGSSKWLEYQQNAVQNTRDFLNFCIRKQNLEFMKDRDTRSVFDEVLLESSRASRDGTSFELRELTSEGLDGYYDTGTLKFRVISD